jgi:AcrR family transcriptional regulator
VATYVTMPRQARAEHTRAAIIDAALSLFGEKGFEAATMRGIAERAGVSLGSAYYYFESKEHLIQGFYDQVSEVHARGLPARLDGVTALTDRLIVHLDLWLDLLAPHHSFAAVFFRSAADPASPLSPFSAASAPARHTSMQLMQLVIDGSDAKVPKTIRAELPELLWLFHMGVVLFWVHDRSHDVMASRLLVRRVVPMLVRAIELARLPVLRATTVDLVALIGEMKTLLATD